MRFSIVEIIRHLWSPNHEFSCSWFLWHRIIDRLQQHGNFVRESGAFLLGKRNNGGRSRIVDFVLYDDIDPHCLDSGIVCIDGSYFGTLWEICQQNHLTVVADVHTHPGNSMQSQSDRDNPMIAQKGHLAIILPRFAKPPVRLNEVGIYRYRGGKRWHTIPSEYRSSFFHIGL